MGDIPRESGYPSTGGQHDDVSIVADPPPRGRMLNLLVELEPSPLPPESLFSCSFS
ncbi:hypothetical protein ACSF6V_09935 [Escherichia coli]|uniref:hypothetical protein n=1 Tax=Escherichia coli TaxID=562 RepID=UPI003EE959C0